MIERLEDKTEMETFSNAYPIMFKRKPNNDEIVEKVNEIIDYLNNKELEE